MGWLRLVGSLKLYLFFVEYRLFQMAVLQKRPLTLLYTEIGGSYIHIYRNAFMHMCICIEMHSIYTYRNWRYLYTYV